MSAWGATSIMNDCLIFHRRRCHLEIIVIGVKSLNERMRFMQCRAWSSTNPSNWMFLLLSNYSPKNVNDKEHNSLVSKTCHLDETFREGKNLFVAHSQHNLNRLFSLFFIITCQFLIFFLPYSFRNVCNLWSVFCVTKSLHFAPFSLYFVLLFLYDDGEYIVLSNVEFRYFYKEGKICACKKKVFKFKKAENFIARKFVSKCSIMDKVSGIYCT